MKLQKNMRRFNRLVASVLALATVAADPSWGLVAERFMPVATSSSGWFYAQAIVPPNDVGFDLGHGADRESIVIRQGGKALNSRRSSGFGPHRFTRIVFSLWLTAAALVSGFGQNPAAEHPTAPPYSSIPTVMQQNKRIAKADYQSLWKQKVKVPVHIDQLEDFIEAVEDNSIVAAEEFAKTEQQSEMWFKAGSRNIVDTVNSDPHLSPRIGLTGPAISDSILYERRRDLNPQSRVTSATIQEDDSWIVKTLKGIRDVFLKGGIEFHSKVTLAKAELDKTIQEIGIRVRYADVETADQTDVKAFQKDLTKLMAQDYLVSAKRQEIHFKEKQRAQWSANPDEWPAGAAQKIQQVELELANLKIDLGKLEGVRSAIDDRLRNHLIWLANEITSRPSLHPRPPTIEMSGPLIETLANVRLPGEVDSGILYKLPSADRLRSRLIAHLDLLAKNGLIPPGSSALARDLNPFSSEFSALLLDKAWVVSQFKMPILLRHPETNPRRRIAVGVQAYLPGTSESPQIIPLELLLQIPPEDPSFISKTPKERGLEFQADVIRAENSRLAKELETESSGAIRVRLAMGLPITAEYERRKVLDPTSILHGLTALEIAEKIPHLMGMDYRRETLLPEAQALRTDRITVERTAREEARLLIHYFIALDNALKPPSPNRGSLAEETLPAATDFATPAKGIIIEKMKLEADITALQGTEDIRFLLTSKGQALMDNATAKHMAASLEGANLLFVNRAEPAKETPGKASAPPVSPSDVKKSAPPTQKWPLLHRPKKDTKTQSSLIAPSRSALRALALMALGPSIGSAMPLWNSFHVGLLNPGTGPMALWLLMPIGLTLYFLTVAVLRNGAVSKSRFLAVGIPATAALFLFLGFPAVWSFAAPLAAFTLASVTALTLPKRVFDFPKHSIPSHVIHFWNSRPRFTTWVNRIGVGLLFLGLTYAFWAPLGDVADRIKKGLNVNIEEANYLGSEIERGPLFTGAPKHESGKIANNPLALGATEIGTGQYTYGVAWASYRDAEFISRIHTVNQRLTELRVNAQITGIDQLQTDSLNSRYRHAFVQVMSDNTPGSTEDQIDSALTFLESVLLKGGQNRTAADQNRDMSGNASLTRRELLDSISLSNLAAAVSDAISKRSWRDQSMTSPIRLLPDAKQLVQGTPVTSASAIQLGIQVRRDVGKFLFILMPQEAATFETFQRDAKAIAVFEDPDTGTQYYFHPSNIQDILEPGDNKGLFGALQHNTAIGPLPEFRIRVPVVMPDGQLLPDQAKSFKLLGFFSEKAIGTRSKLKMKGSLDLKEDYRLHAPTLSTTQKMGIAELMPSGADQPRFAGPIDSLKAQLRDYSAARSHYLELMKEAKQAYLRYNGTGNDEMAHEQRAIFEQAQIRVQELDRIIRDVENEKKEWETTGASSSLHVYPAHPEAAALYPLESKFFVKFPADKEAAMWDHQTLYGLGQQVRLHVKADARHVKDLALKPGEHLQISAAGSSYKIDCALTHVELREQEFPVAYFELELSVDASHLTELYPLMRYGIPPVGAVFVTIEKAQGAPAQTPPAPKKQAPKKSSATRAMLEWFQNLMTPLPIAGATAAAIIPFFPFAGHWLLGLLLSAGAGFLLNRFIRRLPFFRVGKRQIKSLNLAASPAGPNQEAFLLAVNGGSYLTKSKFLDVIGGKIHPDSILSSSSSDTLQPLQIQERALTWPMIQAAIDQITDLRALTRIANHLGIAPSQIDPTQEFGPIWSALSNPAQNLEFALQTVDPADIRAFTLSLRTAVTAAFESKFNTLKVWTLETRRSDAFGTVIPLAHKRMALLDQDFFQWALRRNNQTEASSEEKRIAQRMMFTAFFHFVAVPELMEESAPAESTLVTYTLDTKEQKHFELDFKFIRDLLDPESSVETIADSARAERAHLYPALRGKDAPSQHLSIKGLYSLDERIRLKPTHSELEDSTGKKLSAAKALYDRFQFWGVSEKLARLLAWDSTIQNKWKPLANARTTFVLFIDFFIVVSVGLFVRFPGLLGYIGYVVTRADTTRTLLGMSPTDNLPQWVLNIFLGTLIGAFFLGAYKAVGEFITGNIFDVPATFLWATGGIAKRKKEFRDLTKVNSDDFLERFNTDRPLENEGELSDPLLSYASMMTDRLYKVLLDRNSELDISVKRQVVNCLYQYAETPLHREEKFFDSFASLQLPSEAEVTAAVPEDIVLRPNEIALLFKTENETYLEELKSDLRRVRLDERGLERISEKRTQEITASLRKNGFPLLDDWRRDRIDEKRILLAADRMRKAPAWVLLALISQDLAGWAFYKSSPETPDQAEETEAMEQVLRSLVERLSTLAPKVYLGYRENSRKHNQWEAISLIIEAIRTKNTELAADIFYHFSRTLSEIDVDPTNPRVLSKLKGFQKAIALSAALLFTPLTWVAPSTATWLKKGLGIIRPMRNPQDQLSIALLLNYVNTPLQESKDPSNLKESDKTPRQRGIAALDQILDYLLSGIRNASGAINEDKFKIFLDSSEFRLIRRLAEANKLDIEPKLRSYLNHQGKPEARTAVGEIFDGLNTGSGNRNSLAFQFYRREDKSEADQAEILHARLLGGKRIGDPARPPVYMQTLYLQDENMKPTTSAADLEHADSRATALLDEQIRLKPKWAAAPLGPLELVQEGALAMTRQRTIVDFQRDSELMEGDINLVGISRGLFPFMMEMFNRIRERLNPDVARRIWPLFFHQIRGELRSPSDHRRLVLTSPENSSLEKWLDSAFKDTDVILVPNPYLTSAAKLLAFIFMYPDEKKAYFDSIVKMHGVEAGLKLEREQQDFVHLMRSFHLEIAMDPERYVIDKDTGKLIDNLETKMPPLSYRSFVFLPAGALEKPTPPQPHALGSAS